MNFLEKNKYLFIFLGIALVMLSIWYSTIYFVPNLVNSHFPSPDRANPTFGELGDMFGAVNAIFSGVAFAGIIVTILLQKTELEEQRNELKATREEFQYNRITNLVYKQIERIDEKISQFEVDEPPAAIGQNALFKIMLDLNAFRAKDEELIMGQLSYLNNKVTGLNSIFQTINRSEKIIDNVIMKGNLSPALEDELRMIFRMNIPDDIYKIAEFFFFIEGYLDENQSIFITKTGVHKEWIEEIRRKFEATWRFSKLLITAKQN